MTACGEKRVSAMSQRNHFGTVRKSSQLRYFDRFSEESKGLKRYNKRHRRFDIVFFG